MGANDTVNGWGTNDTSDPGNDDLTQATAKLIVYAFTPYAVMDANGVPAALNNYVDNAVVTGLNGKVGVRTCAAFLDNAAHPGGTTASARASSERRKRVRSARSASS